MIALSIFVLTNCKNDKEEEEPEKLISAIDGEEYAKKMSGEMNAFKAATLVTDGGTFEEEIPYSMLLTFADSLDTKDSTERALYFDALNTVLHEFDSSDHREISDGMFTYFLHHPKELTEKLNDQSGFVLSTWTEILSNTLSETIQDPEITEKSIINVALKNCYNCTSDDQEFIITFVESLKTMGELEN